MWDCYLLDLNYLASDLVSGKSLPVLVAVSVLPLDPNLMGTMVVLGVILGTILTLAQAWSQPPTGPTLLSLWAARSLNHAFAAILSLAFLLRVAQRLHPDGGVLSILPAFCLALQPVPERPSAPFALLVLSLALFWVGILYEFDLNPRAPYHPEVAQRRLMALSRKEWHHQHHTVQTVYHSTAYSITILCLALYASAQHGPVHCLLDAQPTSRRRYISAAFLTNRVYSVWPAVSAAMLRAYVILRTGWLHGNPLHIMLETDPALEDLSTFCAWMHLVVLLYSAAWSVTQLDQQVLTLFQGAHRHSAAATIVALAYLFRWRDAWGGFVATLTIGGFTLFMALFRGI